jgi:serine/threonine-protein kinase
MRESFGDYKVLERVGAGSKAEVFRARDTRAGRTAAIKVLTADIAMDPVAGAPFVDEAYVAAKLRHPNAASLYDIGEQDGRPHLVYEFIQGQTLKALLAGRPINPRRALEFATQIADALAEAHALGLAHRCLRPDKVLVSQKGTAKVTDFGLGRYATAVAGQRLSPGEAHAATAYWAPEQRQGTADHRADIYALGLLLHEMLTGRPPGADGRPAEAGGGAAIDPLFAPVLAFATAVDPASRFDSAATLAATLRELTAQLELRRETPSAPLPSSAPPTPTGAAAPSSRSPVPWLIAGVGLAVLLVWWFFVGG